MAQTGTRVTQVSTDLKHALESGKYQPGARLPTEAELGKIYSVSRPTIRAALRELEAMRLVHTQHGVGTFATKLPAIRAGLERMDSITESIRATGRVPGMDYKNRVIRPLLPNEAERMELATNDQALEVRRSVLADGEVVAYSYDLIPLSVLPKDFDPEELDGSIFRFLRDRANIYVHHGVAEIHAVSSDHVGWGDDAEQHSLYVLLDQVHYDADYRALIYSRTYFIEGRYAFTILRTS
jgi:GntR family transcriptional regulator